MNSIDKNQPEDNVKNVSGSAAIDKIKEIIKKSSVCFFNTAAGTGPSGGVRPMTVQQVDDEGALWFLSASDSHTNKEIGTNAEVKLFFQGSAHSDFMTVTGKASISKDKAKIKALWEPIFKTWFTEGEDDARITVIQVQPTAGFYWDTKHGNLVAGLKMLVGAAIGQTLDDSQTGKIKP